MDDTAKLIALFALAAFAMERIVASASYLIDAERMLAENHHLAARKRAQGRRKNLLLALGAAVALLVIDRADLRIIRLVQGDAAPRFLDYWLTWLILVGGASRVRDLLQGVKSTPAATKTTIVKLETDTPVHALREAS
ncbi:MAG TPA: hypothetical protein VJZ00_01240 [Thermoanaerobaculia bacterium]|nr:hypothetical protein [Thermoanaerobaculia bacterium]